MGRDYIMLLLKLLCIILACTGLGQYKKPDNTCFVTVGKGMIKSNGDQFDGCAYDSYVFENHKNNGPFLKDSDHVREMLAEIEEDYI